MGYVWLTRTPVVRGRLNLQANSEATAFPKLARTHVTAVLPSGSTYQIHRREAAEMVIVGAASWKDDFKYKEIHVKQNAAFCVRGLSCRIGEELAGAYRADREKNGWAAAMVGNIRLQRESPSNA